MGKFIFDKYSFLHFAFGMILHAFQISLLETMVLHTMFELSENTVVGMKTINNLTIFGRNVWPGGKLYKDYVINNIGDSISAFVGWKFAESIDLK